MLLTKLQDQCSIVCKTVWVVGVCCFIIGVCVGVCVCVKGRPGVHETWFRETCSVSVHLRGLWANGSEVNIYSIPI